MGLLELELIFSIPLTVQIGYPYSADSMQDSIYTILAGLLKFFSC